MYTTRDALAAAEALIPEVADGAIRGEELAELVAPALALANLLDRLAPEIPAGEVRVLLAGAGKLEVLDEGRWFAITQALTGRYDPHIVAIGPELFSAGLPPLSTCHDLAVEHLPPRVVGYRHSHLRQIHPMDIDAMRPDAVVVLHPCMARFPEQWLLDPVFRRFAQGPVPVLCASASRFEWGLDQGFLAMAGMGSSAMSVFDDTPWVLPMPRGCRFGMIGWKVCPGALPAAVPDQASWARVRDAVEASWRHYALRPTDLHYPGERDRIYEDRIHLGNGVTAELWSRIVRDGEGRRIGELEERQVATLTASPNPIDAVINALHVTEALGHVDA